MKKTALALTMMTGLVVASAAFAADQIVPNATQQPAAPAAMPEAYVPDVAYGRGAGDGMGCMGQRDGQWGAAQGGRMGMMRGYQQDGYGAYGRDQIGGRQGFGEGQGRHMRAGQGWVAGITVALTWILMILGIAALVKHLKKDCAFSLSWRKRNTTEAK